MITPTTKKRFVEWFGPLPEVGDFLKNGNTGNCWLIESVIEPKKPGGKTIFTAVCSRLDKDAVDTDAPGVHGCYPVPRERLNPRV